MRIVGRGVPKLANIAKMAKMANLSGGVENRLFWTFLWENYENRKTFRSLQSK